MDDEEERIREFAYRIWVEEGFPAAQDTAGRRGFPRRLVAGALCAAFSAFSLNAPASAQGSEVATFSYTLVEDQVSPHSGQVRTNWTRIYRLTGKNAVSQTIAMNGRTLETGSTSLGHAGSGVSAVNGLSYNFESHVVGGAITTLEEAPTFRVRTVIRSDGRTSCSATREYQLKPGHKFFEVATTDKHVPESDTNIHIENASCAISGG